MKNAVLIFLVLFLSAGIFAQKPAAGKKRASAKPAASKPSPKPLSEKEQFDAAAAIELAGPRVAALKKFLADFPGSEHKTAALELIASSRGLIAEEKLLSGDPAGAAEIYKLVVEEAPKPYSKELFRETIAPIPATLFWRGGRPAAFELAKLIENNSADRPAQLIELANFYISVENGDEALRLSQAAIALDANSAAAHRTLALAYRVNFDLEQSAAAYAKALELEPDSAAAKRGLAEMKRALGQPAEAEALYRELLAANENDPPARTGLVLSLFEAGKGAEAESELAKSLEQNPGNVILMAGAAYWYAANKNGDKAIELAQRAVEKEPRYIWSHIALARGYMAKKNPVQAEHVLIKARKYGNFPTLEYELASARLAAGFFREAAEGVIRSFAVKNGSVETKLGGRVPRSADSFTDLVAFERKASIFAPIGADSPDLADQLERLVEFTSKLNAAEANEAEIAAAADAFAAGEDNMRLHRQLYAANVLLQKKVALPKVLELTQAATGNTDTGLDVPSPSAAVLANELYNSRSVAFSRDEFLLVPEVPKQTLSAILRGQVEEITGWALYQQDNYPAAVVRLRRAVSVLPPNSAWWRSSLWRLGAAQEASGLDKEALASYVESFRADKPDYAKYLILEALYKKINGSTEGLDVLLGQATASAKPAAAQPEPTPVQTETAATPAVENKSEIAPASARPPLRFPRSVPVSVEPARNKTADAEPPQKVGTAATDTSGKTGNTIDNPQPAVVAAPVETVNTAPAENDSARRNVKEIIAETVPAPAANGAGAKTEAKTETAGATVKAEQKTVNAEAERTETAPPVSGTPAESAGAGPAVEKKAESIQSAPAVVDAAAESVKAEEQKVELPAAETRKKEGSTPAAEIKREAPPPPPVKKEPEESHIPPVDVKREEPPSPPGSAGQAEVKISAASNVKNEDNPPPVKLKVATTSNLPLDEPSRVVTAKKTAPKTPTDTGRQAANKPLFEPIIITVPKRSGETSLRKANQSSEPSAVPGNPQESAERPSDDTSKPVRSGVTERNREYASGSIRPRVIITSTFPGERKTTCRITTNKEEVSVLRNDGGIRLVVGVEGSEDVNSVEAISSSPTDVEVVPDETDGTVGQRSYIVRSISEKRGVFQVRLASACGSKGVAVRVR